MRRDGRDPLLVLEADQRSVDSLHPGAGFERPCQHLVHVDGTGDFPEETAPAALFLGSLDRPGELDRELVHPLLEGLDDRADALVGPLPRPPAHEREQHDEKQHEAAERRRDDNE